MKLARRQREDQGTLARHGGDLTPFNQLSRIRSEINRIFEDPFSVFPSTSFFEGWEPAMDVYDDKDKITVRAEVPGMKKEDIQISVECNTLTISGERKEEEKRERRQHLPLRTVLWPFPAQHHPASTGGLLQNPGHLQRRRPDRRLPEI